MRVRNFALILCFAAGCRGVESLQTPGKSERTPANDESITAVKFEETSKPAKTAPTPRQERSQKPSASATQTPPADDDSLGKAAICIDKGDNAGAAEHLRKHLQAQPDQIMIRVYLAELLLKMRKLAEAYHQFDRFVADAQDAKGPAKKQLLHCHTRLMEIAQDRNDLYGEHLHRGIGMILLARQLDTGIGSDDVEPGFRERLLCKAVAELNKAKKLRPDEPRPHCYLVEAFTKLNQPHSAEKSLQAAKHLAELLPVSPCELKALHAR